MKKIPLISCRASATMTTTTTTMTDILKRDLIESYDEEELKPTELKFFLSAAGVKRGVKYFAIPTHRTVVKSCLTSICTLCFALNKFLIAVNGCVF